jgi:hypothetical protein
MMTLPLRPAHRPAIALMAAAAFFFLLWLAAALKAETVVVINELKSDTPGADVGEFIELYAYESTSGRATAFFPLDGYLVVFFNGASPSRAAYQVTPAGGKPSAFISLDGKTTNAGGFFVIGSAAVPGSDLVLQSGSTGWLQNGADAIGLYNAPEIVFTTATGATATGLVDAVVYGTDDADDLELLATLTPGGLQLNESPNSVHALARQPDGGPPFTSGVFAAVPATPGTTNQPVASFSLSLDPGSLREGSILSGTLSRQDGSLTALTVTLASSDAGEMAVPSTLTFNEGETSTQIVITGVDDLWPDGPQSAELRATAPGYVSFSATMTVADDGDPLHPLVINEVFVSGEGDANLDGATGRVQDHFDDEFVEIVNRGAGALDLGGYQLFASGSGVARHIFPPGSVLAAGAAMVVFGGGHPATGITPAFGHAWVQTASATTLGLYLTEPSAHLSLRNPVGVEAASFAYDDQHHSPESLTLDPDIVGTPAAHGPASAASTGGTDGLRYSPGTRADGQPFVTLTAALEVEIHPRSIAENAGPEAAVLTVRRPPPFHEPLVVMLLSHDPSEVMPVASVLTIPAGDASAWLSLRSVDDTTQDGPQSVTLTGVAAGHFNGSFTIEVTDDGQDAPSAELWISEIDSDQTGADTAEFIELHVGEPAARSLDGYWVVLFNGNHPVNGAYAAYDLTGRSSDADGFFIIGNALVPGVDWVIPDATLQNGADAIAIFRAPAAPFVTTGNPTPATYENLVDVVVYGNNHAEDSDLIAAFQDAGLPPAAGLTQHNEGSANNAVALARVSGSPGPFSTFGSFVSQTPSPGTGNTLGPPLPPTIDITVRDGAVVVTFTGILEQASTLSPHSFAPVAGATNPYSLPLPLPGGLFFRATRP